MATWDFRCAMSLHMSLQVSFAFKTAAALSTQVVPHFIVTLSVYLKSALGEECLATNMTHMAPLACLPKVCVNVLFVIVKT